MLVISSQTVVLQGIPLINQNHGEILMQNLDFF